VIEKKGCIILCTNKSYYMKRKLRNAIYKPYKMKTTEKLTVNLWRILSILPALANPSKLLLQSTEAKMRS